MTKKNGLTTNFSLVPVSSDDNECLLVAVLGAAMPFLGFLKTFSKASCFFPPRCSVGVTLASSHPTSVAELWVGKQNKNKQKNNVLASSGNYVRSWRFVRVQRVIKTKKIVGKIVPKIFFLLFFLLFFLHNR